MSRYASVVLTDPSLSHLDRAFTYASWEGPPAAVGSLVRVPFRGRPRTGVVVSEMADPDVDRPLRILDALGPGLPPQSVSLAGWVADRYLSTLGEALAATLPPRVVSEETAPRRSADYDAPVEPGSLATARNGERLLRALRGQDPAGPFVWRPRADESRGRTISAMASLAIARGRGVIVLVPEVRVTGEVVASLREAYGDGVAWLGTGAGQRARYASWLALRSGAKRLAVGGRGAVFAPISDLGLVIVDDEGHPSYKEARAPRYDARTVAAERARREGALLVLVGSPPSIEARAAGAGSYALVVPERSQERASRPAVTVVDRARESSRLVPLAATLRIVGAAISAERRAVIVAHRAAALGAIAERAGRIVRAREVAVLDAGTDPHRLRRALRAADLIVASPVVAKDAEIDRIGAVAIVEADAALGQPEFRAAEDAFATWWHVGRWAAQGGKLVVETRHPRHPAVVALARWDPDVLWRAETERRRELGYPPFASLARIDVPAERAASVAVEIEERAPGLEVLGPAERAGRWVIVVRARQRETLLAGLGPLVRRWRAADEPMRVDVDPREVLVPKWRSSTS